MWRIVGGWVFDHSHDTDAPDVAFGVVGGPLEHYHAIVQLKIPQICASHWHHVIIPSLQDSHIQSL